ncbi:hypothetical protein [Aeromicrobium sp. CTD01-1L150]|uniref:hypothetical protein n=1 Tax=Aeromicrobium sp. CTD01-1L150 TaxID=3341830 RepID=UPI0035BF4512
MSTHIPARQAKGTPAGGQYAPSNRVSDELESLSDDEVLSDLVAEREALTDRVVRRSIIDLRRDLGLRQPEATCIRLELGQDERGVEVSGVDVHLNGRWKRTADDPALADVAVRVEKAFDAHSREHLYRQRGPWIAIDTHGYLGNGRVRLPGGQKVDLVSASRVDARAFEATLMDRNCGSTGVVYMVAKPWPPASERPTHTDYAVYDQTFDRHGNHESIVYGVTELYDFGEPDREAASVAAKANRYVTDQIRHRIRSRLLR